MVQVKMVHLVQLTKFGLTVCMIFLFTGCAYQFGTHTSNFLAEYTISNDEIRAVLSKDKYQHEKSIGAVMVGELSRQNWIETKFLEFRYDIKDISDVIIRPFHSSEVLIIKDFKGYVTPSKVYPVSNTDLLFYFGGKRGKVACNIISANGQIVQSIEGDEGLRGQFSYDYSKFYYFKSGRVHRYDVTQMTEEILPVKAYDYLKSYISVSPVYYFTRPTRSDDIFYTKTPDTFHLVDITSGSVLKKLTYIPKNQIYDVFLQGDDTYIFSDAPGRVYFIRNENGDVIDRLDLDEKEEYKGFIRSRWDPVSGKVCFLKMEEEKIFRHYSNIKFKGLLWDFKNKTVKEFTLKCPVH